MHPRQVGALSTLPLPSSDMKTEEYLLLTQMVMRSPGLGVRGESLVPVGVDFFSLGSELLFLALAPPYIPCTSFDSTICSCKCLWIVIRPILLVGKLPTINFITAFYGAACFHFSVSKFLLSSEDTTQYLCLPTHTHTKLTVLNTSKNMKQLEPSHMIPCSSMKWHNQFGKTVWQFLI